MKATKLFIINALLLVVILSSCQVKGSSSEDEDIGKEVTSSSNGLNLFGCLANLANVIGSIVYTSLFGQKSDDDKNGNESVCIE